MSEPEAVFSLALNPSQQALELDPSWTPLTGYDNLVANYSIDRGRQYELDHTDVGRASVTINDPLGLLDPTNTGGDFYGMIEPLIPAVIRRYNPVSDQWHTRYRGFVEGYSYSVHPSQRVGNQLTLTLVDLQALLSQIEMVPGKFGQDTTGSPAEGQIGYQPQTAKDRVENALADAGIPDEWSVVFEMNVDLLATTYSPGESVMTVIQDAADAEFPGVANTYVDAALGRICVHGRLARFEPLTIEGGATPGAWDFHDWHVGDEEYVMLEPTEHAHIRTLAYERGLDKVINSAYATPMFMRDQDAGSQHVEDTTSQGLYGIRSWSAQNLQTKGGRLGTPHTTGLEETKLFAQYYVDNFKYPKTRITEITFRSMRPDDPRAEGNWRFLSLVDISDRVYVNVDLPGGGGFVEEPFFVEGVHETVRPLDAPYDDVTLSLDLSPEGYYAYNPFPLS